MKTEAGMRKEIHRMLVCFNLNVQHLGLCTLCAGVKYFEVFLQKLRGKNCLLFFFLFLPKIFEI